ncbi:exonuclease [Streptomyces spongiicola]|uniref:Nuclease SbcCD subunit C n=1 Tax=Streptomyces spongiicola TaxID=1690221 RepID=A0A388STP1_9ACTN|nr:SMC family ATPase [Streptomyces spongiicola]GBP99201.1 exonuclease [Streptomyces spongiicola]
MRLHRLEITAFGPFATRQQIDFDTLSAAGLFLLHGPTGAGKTSVLDAVCYALYGAVPGDRQGPGTSLRSDHAPAGTCTEVCLDLTAGGRRLEITRRPAQPRPKKKGTGVTTEKAQSRLREYDAARGEWTALSRSHQEIGDEIAQLVGMSRDQFCQVVLLPQGEFARFLRADAEARGKLLGRLFDTRRFALVEARLAELRRAAEQQVRDGDERLLALAHRMGQAAGNAAGAWPAPTHRPGDPGLADAVLQWAAVARADARESLAVAASARSAARTRQSAARHELDAERELAALQRRHDDAVRRAGELAERRPATERARARLEQARRAELVGPALRLREDAEREHDSADAAARRVRAALPAALADTGAERLSELEHELRQELGGLDAARRAELRSAGIARELGELDRQSRDDDVILRDAEGWLADWDTVRRSLQDRIEAAQEAATRAEHLAGRLEPARRRVTAARDRDRLAIRADAVEHDRRSAGERAGAAREQWLDLKERRLLGIAAELAAGLAPGEPCAVCGATEHPAPARPGQAHVDRAAEDAAYEEYAAADRARAEAERELAVLRGAFTAAREAARESAPEVPGDGGGRRASSSVSEPGVPSSSVSEPGVPSSFVSEPGVPSPSVPEPGVPSSFVSEPGVPSPSVSEPGVPSPSVPSPSAAPDDLRGGEAADGAGEPTGPGARGTQAPAGGAAEVRRDPAAAPDPTAVGGSPRAVAVAEHSGGGTADAAPADPALTALEEVVARLEREHRQAHALAAGTHDAREALDRAEREHGERLAARHEAERRAVARTSRREALESEQTVLDAEVARAVGGSGTVADRTALLERRIALLHEAAEAVRAADTAARRLKEADDRLSDAAFRAGYGTPADAATALLDDAGQRDLQRRLDAWQAEEAAVADRLAEPGPRAAAAGPPARPEAALRVFDAAESALRDAVSALDSARERCAELDRLSRLAAAEARRLGPLRDDYERVARLAGLTAGTSADNERRMRLESYVLAGRLEQVAAAATVRLRRMSAGRYTLVHSDARSGGKRSGLGLHVVDAWTGRERDTATLSGGETFFVSLALALGLADVVTDEAGGARLDTLFIDEGFGSLDDQTLDEVLDVLDSLRERDRSVGIVSHVADLRRRIPARLEVVKERDGSAVRLRSSPVGG